MRILQVNSAKSFGGGEKHLVDLSRGLIARGHEVFLAVAPNSPIPERLSELPDESILRVRIKNAADFFAVLKLVHLIKKHRIDIVHAHTGKDYLPAGFAARFAPHAKFLLTRHVLFPLKAIQKFALSNAAKAIGVSAGVESSLRRTFKSEKIVTIPNGIDIENWASVDQINLKKSFCSENNLPYDAPLVGCLGELKHLKGQQDLILAAQIVVKRFPNVRFVIAGKDHSYDKSFRREIKRLVETLNLEERFIWFDWIEDTRPLLSSLEIFVSPSHSESFGLAILEAMALGCAVVSTDTLGAQEIIEPNRSGILTEIKNPAKLADAICKLLDDDKLRSELGVNAQQHARANFGLNKMIVETEKVYRDVLGSAD